MMTIRTDAPRKVLITLSRDSRDDIEQVARALREVGMQVANVYPSAGTITGLIPAGLWDRVFAVKGVSAIEEEPLFRAM